MLRLFKGGLPVVGQEGRALTQALSHTLPMG